MIIIVKFSDHLSFHIDTKLEKQEKKLFSYDENPQNLLLIFIYNIYESSVNYVYHVIHYIPSTYLSYNWKFVPFDCLHPIFPLSTPHFLVTTNLISISIYFLKIILLFMQIVLGLHHCTGFSLVVVSGGLLSTCGARASRPTASLVAEQGLQGMGASVVAVPGVYGTGSIVVVYELSCSEACGIFLDQGANPCLLHWPADSLPLNHQGSPL